MYAYLALGDALERQKEIKKAIYVYRDLMSLEITVHGLKEKLSYLEGIYEDNMQKELQKQEILTAEARAKAEQEETERKQQAKRIEEER